MTARTSSTREFVYYLLDEMQKHFPVEYAALVAKVQAEPRQQLTLKDYRKKTEGPINPKKKKPA
jgi:hypothetical protein